jgi:hypothetical protein
MKAVLVKGADLNSSSPNPPGVVFDNRIILKAK